MDQQRIHFTWLIKLRFLAIAGQIATILIVDRALDIALPLPVLGIVLGAELAANLVALWRVRKPMPIRDSEAAGAMALDLAALTALLHLTGGPFNPFSILYLVHIALAAVVLRPFWAWWMVALSAGGFAALFLGPSMNLHAQHMRLHLQGMWAAFAVAASFMVYFVTRATRALARREAELQRAQRLASLATLAAGAAHELSTPLATIATAAKELERELASGAVTDAAEDARLIREQVARCRAILEQMAADAGESPGEGATSFHVRALLDEALGGLSVSATSSAAVDDRMLKLPLRPVAQAVRALVKNALDATSAGGAVTVRAEIADARLFVTIEDTGAGMPADVLARAGEPFFTTKAPGRGMGLGLFVARSVIEQVGGRLSITSRPGAGTTAQLFVPVAT